MCSVFYLTFFDLPNRLIVSKLTALEIQEDLNCLMLRPYGNQLQFLSLKSNFFLPAEAIRVVHV